MGLGYEYLYLTNGFSNFEKTILGGYTVALFKDKVHFTAISLGVCITTATKYTKAHSQAIKNENSNKKSTKKNWYTI